MMLAKITSPKQFLTPSVLEPTIKSNVEAMGTKQTSQQKLVHARKELQMDDLESEPRKEDDADSKSLHSYLEISRDNGPHQMKRKRMTNVTKYNKEIEEPPQKKSKFGSQEQKGKQDKFKGKKKFGSPNCKKFGRTSKLPIHERTSVAKTIRHAHAKGGRSFKSK
jgi:hypothetical protein